MAASDAFTVITLKENDVPGAKFVYESIEKHSNTQIMRWLECRGLPKTGDRSKLLKRVHSCIEAKENNNISVGVDCGKWYAAKLQNLKSATSPSASDVPLLPYSGWGKFPSKSGNLPRHFNKGHIHHHIIESVQFINQSSVLNNDDEDQDIEDVHTAKPLKKGLTFFESGHVQHMQDCGKSGHYFLKAKVMASYRVNVSYDVTVTLSELSGFVRDASCTCVASAMERCSHVTALLYALVDYIEKSEPIQPEASSCTSLPCTWNQGRKKNKNPQKVQDSVYSSKKQKVINVINFDPRAPSTVQNSEELNAKMLRCLGRANQFNSMWMSLLEFKYDEYEIDTGRETLLKELSNILLDSLKIKHDSNFYPVELLENQGDEEWFNQRRLRITASHCKKVANFKSVSAISNFLKGKLWSTDKVTSSAMAYGISNEAIARQSYQASQDCSMLKVIKTGFWVSSDYSELGASPDGLILDLNEPTRYGVLEIKCPKVLEGKTVSNFKDVLSQKQVNQFPLEILPSGEIVLKTSHAYYYQIQMQMGVMGLKYCDFVVWSCKELFVKRVRFDEDFWTSLKEKLVKFHHSYMCPEFFEMRIPRELPPYQLL